VACEVVYLACEFGCMTVGSITISCVWWYTLRCPLLLLLAIAAGSFVRLRECCWLRSVSFPLVSSSSTQEAALHSVPSYTSVRHTHMHTHTHTHTHTHMELPHLRVLCLTTALTHAGPLAIYRTHPQFLHPTHLGDAQEQARLLALLTHIGSHGCRFKNESQKK